MEGQSEPRGPMIPRGVPEPFPIISDDEWEDVPNCPFDLNCDENVEDVYVEEFFPPPPPPPPWLNAQPSSDATDDPDCDLCPWAVGNQTFDSLPFNDSETSGTFILVLVLVAFASAICGAILVFCLIRCRKSKEESECSWKVPLPFLRKSSPATPSPSTGWTLKLCSRADGLPSSQDFPISTISPDRNTSTTLCEDAASPQAPDAYAQPPGPGSFASNVYAELNTYCEIPERTMYENSGFRCDGSTPSSAYYSDSSNRGRGTESLRGSGGSRSSSSGVTTVATMLPDHVTPGVPIPVHPMTLMGVRRTCFCDLRKQRLPLLPSRQQTGPMARYMMSASRGILPQSETPAPAPDANGVGNNNRASPVGPPNGTQKGFVHHCLCPNHMATLNAYRLSELRSATAGQRHHHPRLSVHQHSAGSPEENNFSKSHSSEYI